MKYLIVLLLTLVLAGCQEEVSEQLVTLTVSYQPYEIAVSANGQLRAVKATAISVPTSVRSAQTISWLEKEGSRVNEGDELIRFDDTDLLIKEVDTRTDLKSLSYQKMMDQLTHGLGLTEMEGQIFVLGEEREQAFAFAPRDEHLFKRIEIIDGETNIQFLDTKIEHYQGKKGRHEKTGTTQQEIHKLKENSHQIQLDQIQANKEVLQVSAPHDGVFYYKRNWRGEEPKVGDTVWPGRPLGELPDLSEMEAKVYVLEKEAGGIKEGLAARVILDARPGYEFEAEVTTVAALAKPIERESPVNYFEVILSLEKTYPEFMKPGSFTQATIFIEKQDQVLAVPNQVIFHEGEENWVWLVHKDKAEKRVVTLGRRGPTRTIITAGLESGDMIALSAPQGGELTMEWYQDLMQALGELANHKLRTLLTLLGMIFGVGAVIAMLSVGEGAEREALRVIDTMGLRNILVKAKPTPDDMLTEIREDSLGLSLDDLKAARETLPFLSGYTAIKNVRTYSIFNDYGKSDATVLGISPSHFDLANLKISRGRTITDVDDREMSQVCVIGAKAAQDLFGNRQVLGGLIKINHLWFTVIGVLEDNRVDTSEFEGVKLKTTRNDIFVPISAALKRFKFKNMEDELDEFHIQLKEGSNSRMAALTLSRLLETRHRGVDDFELVVPEALLAQHRKTQSIFNIVMSAIAGISLLVGGIGIMNIMLASVLERTREVGIRRAIGATRRDIKRLFMIEAFTISCCGGMLGIVLGFIIAKLIAGYSGWATAWSINGVFLSVGVCAGIGLVFGIYPAMKAARLSPIDALRHD